MTDVITKPDRRQEMRREQDMHECKHEVDLALMAKGIEDLGKSQEANFGRLIKIIEGNGDDGLVTKTKVNADSITKLWRVLFVSIPSILTLAGIFLAVVKYL